MENILLLTYSLPSFEGETDGNFIFELSKNISTKNNIIVNTLYKLNSKLNENNEITKGIVQEMRDRYHYYMDEYGQESRNVIMNYGKQFKKACGYLGIRGKTLHSLRHTYAVRRWAITGEIKMVSQEIGHASVVMIEKYANFNSLTQRKLGGISHSRGA